MHAFIVRPSCTKTKMVFLFDFSFGLKDFLYKIFHLNLVFMIEAFLTHRTHIFVYLIW